MDQKSQYILQRSVDLCFFTESRLVADYLRVTTAVLHSQPLQCAAAAGCVSPLSFLFPRPYFKLPELAEQDLPECLLRASCNMRLWSQDESMDVGALSMYGTIYGQLRKLKCQII